MDEADTLSTPLALARGTLFRACRRAGRLARNVERLEAAYEHEEGPLNPGYFNVPSTAPTGRDLEPDWTDHAPPEERSIRRAAIDATLALRSAVDEAIEAVKCVASCMDGLHESVDQRWTMRTIGELRKLRGAINRGHAPDLVPSALPMIRAGVPEALREASLLVAARMEEVKSAILAGGRPRPGPLTDQSAGKGSDAPPRGVRFAHAEDFNWIIFDFVRFAFSKGNQAESIKALWESWERGGRRDGCGLSEKTIGEKCGSGNNNFRLQHVFRDHRAWRTIIRPVSKGVFALFTESPKNHTS